MDLGVSDRDDRPLIVLDLGYRSPAAGAIQNEATRRNWRLVNTGAFLEAFPRGLSPVGAIGDGGKDHDMTRTLLEMNIPFVRIAHLPRYHAAGLPTVFAAFEDHGKLAAEFFAERGFRNLAYVGSDPWGDARPIYEGFADTARSLGCEPHLYRIRAGKTSSDTLDKASRYRRRSEEVSRWLKSLPGPVGLLGYSDRMAARLCIYCIENGLRVPEDVAILGIGNDKFFCETAPVALSSIDLPWDAVGQKACDLLQSLMTGGEAPADGPLLIPSRDIVERRSTDVIAVSDPVAARTMQYLWDNLDTDVRVDDLVAEMGVSRSVLERRFKTAVGHGINAELRRKRMEVTEDLLRGTDLKVYVIAQKVGFNSLSYFYRFFSRKHGMTPADFRKQFLGTRQSSE